MKLIVHVDGGSRGNPGPAGAGVTIAREDGTLVHEAAYFLGKMTNNSAEYHALIRALQRIEACDAQSVTICSDSELMVKQVTGEYRVKSPALGRLHEQVQLLLLKTPRWSIRHVRREQNQRADELANLAMDRGRDVVVFDDDPTQADRFAGGVADAAHADRTSPDVAPAEPTSADAAQARPASALPDASESGKQAARVSLASPEETRRCPAGEWLKAPLTVEHTLPDGFCVHAAHALVPTILAILNTDSGEFSAVPTLTVKCTNPDCRATFHVAPTRPSNGAAKRDRDATVQ